eukprot:6895495-Prymnesium_polylepis.1
MKESISLFHAASLQARDILPAIMRCQFCENWGGRFLSVFGARLYLGGSHCGWDVRVAMGNIFAKLGAVR